MDYSIGYLGFIKSLFLEKKNSTLRPFVCISKTQESPLLSLFCHLIPTGAKACKELQLYEEAIKWCCDGLAVSFTNAITNSILFLVPPIEFFVSNHLRMICSESSNQPYKIGLNYCESISLTFRRFRQNIIFFAQHWGLFVRANTRVSADF